jgi:hypothetical protein
MTSPTPNRLPSLDFPRVRVPGTSAFTQRVEGGFPEALLRHSVALSWLWIAVWAAVALTEELTDIPTWVFTVATVLMIIPSVVATALCLWVTPRGQLFYAESILSHFVIRFVTVVFAFLAWTVSIVIGASVSSVIQLVSEGKERDVLGVGFSLMAAFAPVVAVLIWLGLVLRCCWFLGRLRGWRVDPNATSLPPTFLAQAPRMRILTIRLAHPALLATAGILSSIGTVLIGFGHSVVNVML